MASEWQSTPTLYIHMLRTGMPYISTVTENFSTASNNKAYVWHSKIRCYLKTELSSSAVISQEMHSVPLK